MTLAPEAALGLVDDLIAGALASFEKASKDMARVRRDRDVGERFDESVAALTRYFRGFARRNGVPRIQKRLPTAGPSRTGRALFSVFDDAVDWDRETGLLSKAIVPEYEHWLGSGKMTSVAQIRPYASAFGAGSLAEAVSAPSLAARLDLGDYDLSVQHELAKRIKGITEASRAQVRGIVATGIERGLSQRDIIRGVDGFPGLGRLVTSWGSSPSRARVIVKTESAVAYNLGQMQGYRESGIVESVRIFDGADCGWTSHNDPDKANGSIRTLAAAQAMPISHPNCQRSVAPVVLGADTPNIKTPRDRVPDTGGGIGAPPTAGTAPLPAAPSPVSPGFNGSLNRAGIEEALGRGTSIHAKDAAKDWREAAEDFGFPDAATMQVEVERRLQVMMKAADPRIQVDDAALRSIVADGRFKSQFESGSSRGMFDPAARARAEKGLLDLAEDLPVEQRPIYGWLAEGDSLIAKHGAEQYGGVTVRLKKDILSRATFTGDDSLNAGMVPSPVTSPSPASLPVRYSSLRLGKFVEGPDPTLGNTIERGYQQAKGYSTRYWEAQYQGGVGTDDIAEVVFDRKRLNQLPEHKYRAIRETMDEMDQRNIPWRIADFEEP